jgi:hypothetical protein
MARCREPVDGRRYSFDEPGVHETAQLTGTETGVGRVDAGEKTELVGRNSR